MRDGKRRKLTATLGTLKDGRTNDEGDDADSPATATPDDSALGISVVPLDDRLRRQHQVRADIDGVVVASVGPGSRGASLGLQPGDVIVEVNRKPVRSPAELRRNVDAAGDDLVLLVHRQGSTMYLAHRR